MSVLAYITDLFFQVKVSETGKQLGLPVKVVTSASSFEGELGQRPSLIVVDLAVKGTDSLALIRRAKKKAPVIPVLAFGAHVDKELLQKAKEAGADRAMPRSSFSKQLPKILSSAFDFD